MGSVRDACIARTRHSADAREGGRAWLKACAGVSGSLKAVPSSLLDYGWRRKKVS